MARRSNPQDFAGEPPPERRCTGIVRSHQANAGQRCTQWTVNGLDVCPSHSDKKPTPSHNPPPERRCQGKALDEHGHRTKPCTLWAIRGLTICYRHGGSNWIMRAAGERRVAEDKVERKARKLADRLEIRPVTNPLEALALHVGEEIRFKDAVGDLVNKLSGEDLRYTDARGAEQLRSEIVVFERALGRVGDRLVAYAKLNIDERLAAIQEKQAEAVVRAVDAALAHAGVTGPAAFEARQVAARHLEAVS